MGTKSLYMGDVQWQIIQNVTFLRINKILIDQMYSTQYLRFKSIIEMIVIK